MFKIEYELVCHRGLSTYPCSWGLPLAAAAAKSLQSCLTLCDSIDGSPPGSPIPGILQARTLEWGAISFSNAWKWKVKVKLRSRVRLLATQWTAAYQAPRSMGFARQEYWSGVPSPSLGDYLLGAIYTIFCENSPRTNIKFSCLGNPMDRGAWQDTIHKVTNSWTQLSD